MELEDYPELFTGLGCLPGTYHIELTEGAIPVVHPPLIDGDDTTHDEHLQKFLERASKQGLKLNEEKCKICRKEVPYAGHLLTGEGLKIDP